MMRRRYSNFFKSRWVVFLWCSGCLFCLSILALRDTIPSLPQLQDFLRSRHCPPPPAMESDSCLSWRSLHVTQPGCGCKRNVVALHDACLGNTVTTPEEYMSYTRTEFGNSTCSDQATLRGPRQHVLVYGGGAMDNDHLNILNETLHQVKELYPGWVVRLYTYATPTTEKLLCDILCQHHHFDLCDMSKITHSLVMSKDTAWSGWRWWVLGDPLVAVWESRTLGTAVTPREAHAVTQFINSEKCWHVQRDHELQMGPLGSGLLGGKSAWGQEDLLNLRKHLLNELSKNEDETKMLEAVLGPLLQQDTMVHSSVLCWQNSGTVPFPSKRRPGEWIGMSLGQQKTIKNVLKTSLNLRNHLKKKENEETQSFQKKKDKIMIRRNLTNNNESPKSEMIDDFNVKMMVKISQIHKTPIPKLSEHDINLSQGITTCPGQCRPLLHPDWEYC